LSNGNKDCYLTLLNIINKAQTWLEKKELLDKRPLVANYSNICQQKKAKSVVSQINATLFVGNSSEGYNRQIGHFNQSDRSTAGSSTRNDL